MRLLPISQKITAELKKVENARKVDRAPKTVGTQKTDHSEFSSGAQRLSETQANAGIVAANVENQPEIRADKIAEVREKIANGYYNSPEFVDKLAEKLISDFGLGQAPQA